jgi:hypothetical protein
MNFAKRISMFVGFVALAVACVLLLAPKTTHALVAALVQVTNTTANPAVIQDADKATRIPYQSNYTYPATDAGVVGYTVSSFAAVPLGYRLVIQNVSAFVWAESGNPIPSGSISSTSNPDAMFPSFSGVYTGGQQDIVNANVVRYIGPGDTPQVTLVLDALHILGGVNHVTVTGYLENCAVTGCPPVTE